VDKHGLWISMAKDKRYQAATSAKQVRWAAEVKRRPQRAAIAFLRDARELSLIRASDHGYVLFSDTKQLRMRTSAS
jgi:hypothetical protein